MASPIGGANTVVNIGYDNTIAQPINSVYWPALPLPIASSTCNVGTFGTASTETTGTQTFSTFARQTTQAFFANPFLAEDDIVFREVDIAVSGNTVAGTGRVTGAYMMGLYAPTTTWGATMGSGGPLGSDRSVEASSGSFWTAVSRFGYNFRHSQNSVTDNTFSLWTGTDSAATSGWSTTSGNISTDFTGIMRVNLFSSTAYQTLPRGQYMMVHGYSKISSVANVFSNNNVYYLSQSQTATAARYMGSGAYDSPVTLAGSFTTSGSTTDTGGVGTANVPVGVNLLPGSFNQTVISNTATADVRWLVPSFF